MTTCGAPRKRVGLTRVKNNVPSSVSPTSPWPPNSKSLWPIPCSTRRNFGSRRRVPRGKLQHFAAEAKSLDAARMLALAPPKRTALLIALVVGQTARALDDLAEMLIKRLSRIHQRDKEALTRYREQHQERTDRLIATLHEMVVAYQSDGTEPQRL